MSPVQVADEIVESTGRPRRHTALLVVQGGEVVVERYGERPANLFQPVPSRSRPTAR